MKKIISVLLALIMAFGTCAVAFAENQISVPEGYIGIYTAEDLYNIRNNLSGKYILMNDIDLSVYENWEPIGSKETPFTGEFDGNGYNISYLSINTVSDKEENHYFGLFGYSSGSLVKNVLLYDIKITIKHTNDTDAVCYAAAVIGFGNNMEDIVGCTTSGTIEIEGFSIVETGGIIGKSSYSCPVRCSNYADINISVPSTAKHIYVGGITGNAMLKESELSNFGNISLNGRQVNPECVIKAGGIDGNGINAISLTNCYNRGEISINFSTPETYIGGISGESCVTENIYNVGNILVPSNFSGFSGSISGNIYSSWFGIGNPKKMENAYYSNQDIIPAHNAGGMPESFEKKPFINVCCCTDIEMKRESTFIGFDFENIWVMEENGHPVLKNQPQLIASEKLVLTVGEVFNINFGDCILRLLNNDVVQIKNNTEVVAVSEGTATLSAEYDYGYKTIYNITVVDYSSHQNDCLIARLFIVLKYIIMQIAKLVCEVFNIEG